MPTHRKVSSLLAIAAVATTASAKPDAQKLEFFERKVRPLLVEHCYSCHSAESGKSKGGLRLDRGAALLVGGDSGPAVVPGSPDDSVLIEAVRYDGYEMPPSGKLSDEAIAVFEKWVQDGAVWPEEAGGDEAAGGEEEFDLAKRKASHWAWQPITHPEPPAVADADWAADPLDHFVLAKLEAAGLRPAPPRAKAALLRRLYYDLIGLPPSADAVRAFLKDERPDAVERVVDRLLASPQFGERWGRHWLDLVRYAESRGHEFDFDIPGAYQYRDYVVRALNADVPYDQLLREHIAGDLLDEPRTSEAGANESILATGFWHLGEWVHSPVDTRLDEADRHDNMIDTFSKSVLGVTVSCARCHDHKFDAISLADYHALRGFLQSSDYRQVRFESIEPNRKVAERLVELDKAQSLAVREAIAGGLIDSGGLGDLVAAAASTDKPLAGGGRRGRTLVDYASLAPDAWMQDGYLFGPAPRKAGDVRPTAAAAENGLPLAVADQSAAANDPFWDGLVSHGPHRTNGAGQLNPVERSGRTLVTPTVELETGAVYCLVRGAGLVFACVDSHRMIQGPLHTQTRVGLPGDAKDRPVWVRIHLQRYAGQRVHFEFTPAPNATIEVLRIIEEGGPADAKGEQEPTDAAFATNAEGAAEVLGRWARAEPLTPAQRRGVAAIVAKALDDPAKHLAAPAAEQVRSLADAWREQRERLRGEVVRDSQLAPAMMDLSGEDDRLLVRGNVDRPADLIPRRMLEAIDGPDAMPIPRGSGRLQLAERVNAADNPLTHRVIVNRLWAHLIGEGIVRSVDNFGVLGEPPTHPLLLDYLASEFRDDGQSLKRMIRRIVLSSTYAMGNQQDMRALELDPTGRLLWRSPPKRLDAEALRDTLLQLAGKLDPKQGGPAVLVHLTPFMGGRGRPGGGGSLDGDGRRSLYVSVRRNFLSPFALAFDFPQPTSTRGKRSRSNVPAQALALLNDPRVHQCARQWAERLLAAEGDRDARIERLLVEAFGRPPTDAERSLIGSFLDAEAAKRSEATNSDAGADSPEVWAAATHAVINAKEFLFLP